MVIQNRIQELEVEKKEVENLDIDTYDDQTLPMFIQITEERSNHLVQSIDNKVVIVIRNQKLFY